MTTLSRPWVLGAGLVVLDVTLRSDANADAHQVWTGGTCGNVVSILALFGWQAAAVARVGLDAAAVCLANDLKDSGVELNAITREKAGTPLIVHKVTRDKDGVARHSFRFACPQCEKRYPSYRPITADIAEQVRVPHEPGRPGVFFFDRASRGVLDLARKAKAAKAIVVFEPSARTEERHFLEAMELTDVLKYADERREKFEPLLKKALARERPVLEIETHGAKGLSYRTKATRGWTKRPAQMVKVVRDTAGAGDWLTAGILHSLISDGVVAGCDIPEKKLQSAFELGEALAAFNCQFEGPRGSMYETTDAVSTTYLSAVDVQIKRVLTSKTKRLPLQMTLTGLCPACTAAAGKRSRQQVRTASRHSASR